MQPDLLLLVSAIADLWCEFDGAPPIALKLSKLGYSNAVPE